MFTEDLSVFFDVTNGFAIEGTLHGQPFTGILDSGFDDATLEGYGAVGSSPRVILPAASVPANPEGKALVIASGIAAGTYKVGNAYPDGTGLVTLHLIT